MKNKGNGLEMTTRPVPSEITQAVVQLAKLCAKHNLPLDLDTGMLDALIKMEAVAKAQAKVILMLEQRLGIDDEL